MKKQNARFVWIVPVVLALAVLACSGASTPEATATPLPRPTQKPNASATTAPAKPTATKGAAKPTATEKPAQATDAAPTDIPTDSGSAPFTLASKPYTHKSGAFTITLPDGWTVDDYDNSVVARAAGLKPSARGELEITDLNRLYLADGALHVEELSRGYAWLDTGTHDSLVEASEFVRVVQKRQGVQVACLEEIAWQQGFITTRQLRERGEVFAKTDYGRYILRVADGH